LNDTDKQIVGRLDLIQATLRLAFAPQLEEAREKLLADPVAAAIHGHAGEWVGSSALQKAAAETCGKSTRTVRDRLSELVAQGVLESRKVETRVEYRLTGLIA
jgi:DNA-binding HxlR family transcriptional regulator